MVYYVTRSSSNRLLVRAVHDGLVSFLCNQLLLSYGAKGSSGMPSGAA